MIATVVLRDGSRITEEFETYVNTEWYIQFNVSGMPVLMVWHSEVSYIDIG